MSVRLGCVSAKDFDKTVNSIPVSPKIFVKSLYSHDTVDVDVICLS